MQRQQNYYQTVKEVSDLLCWREWPGKMQSWDTVFQNMSIVVFI